MERFDKVFIVAGVIFFLFAYILMGIGPWTTLMGLKPPTGVGSYTGIERRGRVVYIREGCGNCHTQFVRPVTNEPELYGAVSEASEYVYDLPQLFGTRRSGPDLSRVGGKYDDNWHYFHLLNPRSVVRGSIMPPYPWLFNDDGKPTKDGFALVKYMQRLGKWQRKETPKPTTTPQAATPKTEGVGEEAGGVEDSSIPQRTDALLKKGAQLFEENCSLCHGEQGDGKGMASGIEPPPSDFTDAEWKYGSKLEEIFDTISNGIPGTMMPPWEQLSEKELWALTYFVEAF